VVTAGSLSIEQDAFRRIANGVVLHIQSILEGNEGAGPQTALRKLVTEGDDAVLVDYLTHRAVTAYETRGNFRKALGSPDTFAQDILKGFMRHWAAGYVLVNYGEDAFNALPVAYL